MDFIVFSTSFSLILIKKYLSMSTMNTFEGISIRCYIIIPFYVLLLFAESKEDAIGFTENYFYFLYFLQYLFRSKL